MLRFLKYTGRGLFFFKRIRIGFRLVSASFKAIIFEHHKYFIFCLILATVQLFRIILTSWIDPKFSFSFLMNEFLFGQNLFDLIIDYGQIPTSFESAKLLSIKILFLYIEIIIVSQTILAIIYYSSAGISKKNNLSFIQSFLKSFKKFKIVLSWSVLQMIVMLLSALLGFAGEFVQFFWQLSTSLSLQIIAFENKGIISVIKHSFNYFKSMFANIVGIDLLIDIILVSFTAIFYLIYKTQVVPTFTFVTGQSNYSYILTGSIFYLISMVFISETITFTYLYRMFHEHPSKLNR